MKSASPRKIDAAMLTDFKRRVWSHYRKSAREFPWRKTRDPYQILVSEIMLQQTQADRVVPFFNRFVETFPTPEALAHAPGGEVLRLWQGLGYNRRTLFLKRTAEEIVREYGGEVPSDNSVLLTLPGIGVYTASAIRAFAFNIPDVLIETNIRTAIIHHFFPKRRTVKDAEVYAIAKNLVPKQNAQEWYQALMDFGAMIKQTSGNHARRSAGYAKQSRFVGSKRELRGRLIKHATREPLTTRVLSRFTRAFEYSRRQVATTLEALTQEGLLERRGNVFHLP